MNNLTPERPTGRNGNAVTRWIRSLNKKRTNIVSSSPVIEEEGYSDSDPSNEPTIIELFELLHPKDDYSPDHSIAQKIRIIAKKDLSLIQHITEAAKTSPDEREYWLDSFYLSKNLKTVAPWGNETHHFIDPDPEQLERELTLFRTALPVNRMLRALGHNCNVPVRNDPPYLTYQGAVALILKDGNITNPSEDLTKAITLITYMEKLQVFKSGSPADGNATTYSRLSADAAYIAEHLEQVMELLPELVTRGTHDRAVIERLLANDTQALREGEL